MINFSVMLGQSHRFLGKVDMKLACLAIESILRGYQGHAGAPLAQLVKCGTCGFESHQGHGVVSLSKTLHLHCLVLVHPT